MIIVMKQRLLFLVKVVVSILLVFVVGKLVFILVNAGEDKPAVTDLISTCWHGLSLDLTMALYIVTVPALVTIVSIWWNQWKWMRNLLKVYFSLISFSSPPAFADWQSAYFLANSCGVSLRPSSHQYVQISF